MALSITAFIQGRLLLFFFNQLMRFLFEGGFYSRKYGNQKYTKQQNDGTKI